jgi:transposase/heme-degrading monooxygenase HmoA
MILRVFRARIKPGKRQAYEALIRRHSIPLMRTCPGFVAIRVGAPQPDHPDAFCLVSMWRDLDALRGFAGERWEEVQMLPGEAELVEELSVHHVDDTRRPFARLWRLKGSEVRVEETRAIQAARLSDAQWERIEPLLPPPAREGRPRADDRCTLDGIFYVLRTGCRWHELPPEFGSAVTCWRRFTQWEGDGVWDAIWSTYVATLDGPERLVWAAALLNGTPLSGRRWPRRRKKAGRCNDMPARYLPPVSIVVVAGNLDVRLGRSRVCGEPA